MTVMEIFFGEFALEAMFGTSDAQHAGVVGVNERPYIIFKHVVFIDSAGVNTAVKT